MILDMLIAPHIAVREAMWAVERGQMQARIQRLEADLDRAINESEYYKCLYEHEKLKELKNEQKS